MLLSELKNKVEKKDKEDEAILMAEVDEVTKIAFKSLDAGQRAVLLEELESFLVYGKTGSGKTILAIDRVIKLYKKNEKFMLIIYTKALKKFLEGKFRKLKNEDLSSCIYYAEELNKSTFDATVLDAVDYIIIDEAQDFSMQNIEKYKKMANKAIFLFGDDGQQLYPNEHNNEKIIEKLKLSDIKSFELRNIYRLNKKIAKLSEVIKQEKEGLVELCGKIGEIDSIPAIYEFKNEEKEVEFIIDEITKESWKDVGILVKKNEDVSRYFELFRKLGIACEYKTQDFDNLDFSTDRPKILTYHSAKGLEFERVVLANCDLDYEKFNTREGLYVACTRAKLTLIITCLYGKLSTYMKNAIDKLEESEYKYERR